MRNKLDPCNGFAQRTILEYAPDMIVLGFQPLEREFLPCHLETRDTGPGTDGASTLGSCGELILD